jgi:predicted transposase YbfD/YdcC
MVGEGFAQGSCGVDERTFAMLTRLPVIFTCFDSLPDPRRTGGNQQHNLMEMVFTALCAIIGGANHWTDVEEFVESKLEWFRKFVSLEHGVPSHDTYSRVFAALDTAAFCDCVQEWIAALQLDLKGRGVHIDGKTLRRSFDGSTATAALQMVNAWVDELSICLGQIQTTAESNEITAVPLLLELLEIRGAVVTLDAMHCQTKTIAKIRDKQADYVITVKANQNELYTQVSDRLEQLGEQGFPSRSCKTERTVHTTRGRIEERVVTVTAAPRELRDSPRWRDIRSIGVVYRSKKADPNSQATKPVAETNHVTYFISSLPPDAKLLASYVRKHWTVENQLHWSLDVNFTEDSSRIRVGNGAAIFGHLRRIALSVIKRDTSLAKTSQRAKRLKAGWSVEALESIISGS